MTTPTVQATADLYQDPAECNRVLDGFACTHCGAESVSMVPDGFGVRGQLFRCADDCAA